MNTFNIIDTLTKEVVASRKTLNAAKKWAAGLNDGLVGRYIVAKA
jgi:hypothetical protein